MTSRNSARNSSRGSYVYFVRIPLLLSLVGLLCMGVFSRRGWLDLKRISRQNEELKLRLATSIQQKQQLDDQIEAFKTNKSEQERIIRQTLGYVRKNETV